MQSILSTNQTNHIFLNLLLDTKTCNDGSDNGGGCRRFKNEEEELGEKGFSPWGKEGERKKVAT